MALDTILFESGPAAPPQRLDQLSDHDKIPDLGAYTVADLRAFIQASQTRQTWVEKDQIRPGSYPDRSISGAKLVDGAVATVQLADGSVTTAKILDANVTTAKLADGSVTTAKIADANVTIAKLTERPRVILYRNGAYNAPQAETSIPWDTSEYQTTGYSFWVIGNPNVINLPVAGKWRLTAVAAFTSNATGNRQLVLSHDTLGEVARTTLTVVAATTNATLSCSTEVVSNGSNFFVARLSQSSGGALAIATGRRWTRLEAEWMCP